jgi:hypothetical protein
MRALVLWLAVVFSVVLAGMHMPAPAQAVGHHDSHVTAGHDIAGEDQDMPVDANCDFLHHHHCPVALANHSSPALVLFLTRDTDPVPAIFIAPRSRATAPPLKPPSA